MGEAENIIKNVAKQLEETVMAKMERPIEVSNIHSVYWAKSNKPEDHIIRVYFYPHEGEWIAHEYDENNKAIKVFVTNEIFTMAKTLYLWTHDDSILENINQ